MNRLIFILFVALICSCTNPEGYEFMPNMYRSPSLETYGQNTYFSDSFTIYLHGGAKHSPL